MTTFSPKLASTLNPRRNTLSQPDGINSPPPYVIILLLLQKKRARLRSYKRFSDYSNDIYDKRRLLAFAYIKYRVYKVNSHQSKYSFDY